MKKIYLIAAGILLIVVFIFIGRNNTTNTVGSNSLETEGQDDVRLVDAITFSKLADDKDAYLLDVHIPEQVHIPGTDAFISYNEISENQNKLPEDRDVPILVYCRSGTMSAQAAKEIASLGYNQVYDLEGGINAYREANTEVIITPENWDLGEVIYGDVPTASFILTNFTPAALKITRVSTSCGCTSAEVEDKELGAYESTVVNVSFDPAVHKDDTDLGSVTRTIYIDTNNPNYPRITSTITADVIKKN
jgi:rhodanese-related sulfurtransferase